eukprot:scaffold2077_cov119-Cylindrotheca_fusiformis.AAC.16
MITPLLALLLCLVPEAICLLPQQDIVQELSNLHSQEISRGFRTFGTIDSGPSDASPWSESDFDCISLERESAGPSELKLQQGSRILITRKPIITLDECGAIIEDAKTAILQGKSAENTDDYPGVERTNSELNEAKISDLPNMKPWISDLLHEKVFPILASAYGVDVQDLTLNDGLVLGYIGPSRSQPIHRDASLLTLQISLSPQSDFMEGGTYFEALRDSVVMQAGHAMCHSSGTMHAGKGIVSGERWVLVLFVLSKKEPQLAKRCHARGVSAMDGGDYGSAESYFLCGLDVAPSDHLLRLSLAKCYLAQNRLSKAREQLRRAQTYRHCARPYMLHANQLLSCSRPRAALRRLDRALEQINDKDLLPGSWTPLRALAWEIRIQAGRCACLCAERELLTASTDLPWSRKHLPLAIERMRIALDAAPQHEPLQQMIGRAEQILETAF